MRKLALLVSFIAGLTTATAALAAEVRRFNHNGSEMVMTIGDVSGGVSTVTIHYDEPRSGMRGAGVRSGTLFFDGDLTWSTGVIAGTARVFRLGCDPLEYEVRGRFPRSGGTLELAGLAPVFERNGCGQVGETITHNSLLTFEPLRAYGR